MAYFSIPHNYPNGIITYEHYCDSLTDRANIPSEQITIGSYCIVLNNATAVDIYIADSEQNWHLTKNVYPNLQAKSISLNGLVTADQGYDGLSAVDINVPNTYVAADENKVVHNGMLITQTPININNNGTYNTTLNDSVIVNVTGSTENATLISKNIITNGVYNAIDDNADGYYSVTVNVPEATGINPSGTVNITQNGTHDVTQYASANVNVQPNLQSKTATQNGTVTPDTGYDGLSSVTVNVSGGGGSEPQLPSSYQEVEYLATGESAYITPSIVLNPGTLIKAKATRNSASAQTLIGNRTDATKRWDAGYGNGAWYATNSCFLIASNVAGDPTAELLVGLADTVSTGFRYGAYLYSTKYNFNGNLYKLRIYAPTELTNPGVHTLQALFYPCRRKADDVLGFYDAINGVFYPNDGDGTFTPGPDVN